jgi:hypothetical protein
MKLSFKNGTLSWDQFDEDRWIRATILTIIILLLTILITRSIRIPENPKKIVISEEIDFVKPEIKKKEIEVKKIQQQEEKITEEKILEEAPEIELSLPVDMPKSIVNLPTNLPVAGELKIFEQENPNVEQAQATMQITDGILAPESEDNEALDISKGLQTEWNEDRVATTIITRSTGDRSLSDNMGISTAPAIRFKEQRLSTDFSGFKGEIKWEELRDPIFDWIRKNSSPIGDLARLKLTNNDMTARTARKNIAIENAGYILLLASKEEKKELKICLINRQTNEYVMLVDMGLTQTTTLFYSGLIRLDENDEIVSFSRGTEKSSNDPKAQDFMKIFWQWARTVTGK